MKREEQIQGIWNRARGYMTIINMTQARTRVMSIAAHTHKHSLIRNNNERENAHNIDLASNSI